MEKIAEHCWKAFKTIQKDVRLVSAFNPSPLPLREQWAAAKLAWGSLGDVTPVVQHQILSTKQGGSGTFFFFFLNLLHDLTGD